MNQGQITKTAKNLCFFSILGKTNLSRSRKGDKHEDTTGLENAVNSAVYSSVIFVPGIIGFIFVCIRTHRKTKMEEKRLQDLERRKLSLRDDEFI